LEAVGPVHNVRPGSDKEPEVRLNIAAAVCAALLVPATASAQGGPDAFGYTWDFVSVDFVPLAPSLGTAVGINSDDAEATVALPFSFPFYGTSYGSVRVADNGGLMFNLSGSLSWGNQCLPAVSASYPDVAVYWEDLRSDLGDVRSWHDTANGRFIISWEDVPHYYQSTGTGAYFQAHLYPSGLIEFHYQGLDFGGTSYDNGISGTVGVQDQFGGTAASGNALQVSCNSAGTVGPGVGVAVGSCFDDDGDGYTSDTCGGDDCDDGAADVYPGAPEVCADGIDQDCDGPDLAADVDGDGFGNVICGGDDCDDTDASINPDIDADGDGADACVDCDDDDASLNPGVDGDSDGSDACEDCDDADDTVYPGAPELCDLLDNDCDGAAGSAAVYTPAADTNSQTGTGYFRGGKFQATADANIASFAIDMQPTAGQTLSFGVYEASSEGGTYVLIDSASYAAGSGDRDWWSSGALGTPIVGGNWYALGVTWTGSATVWYRSSASASFPYVAPWGLHEGGASSNSFGGALLGTYGFATSGTSYSIEVTSDGYDEADLDGDGVAGCDGDCDDDDALSYPGAAEICDGADNDCDGVVPTDELDPDGDFSFACDGDCDDNDPTVYPGAPELCDSQDNDCDGVGDGSDDDGDGYVACEDCDDADSTSYPGGVEVCDGADNDCDGSTSWPLDEDDGDGDGYLACEECDDDDPGAFPGGAELCNGIDDDCDGAVPADEQDVDFDGWWPCEGDCDDYDSDLNPGESEICDGLDTNCDGGIPSAEEDVDGDGVAPCEGDCDDSDASIHPGAAEVCDGIDNDCDGVVPSNENDSDGDGYRVCDDDCDDLDPNTSPAAAEICDGEDNDCNGWPDADASGEVDADLDGSLSCEDCDDSDSSTWPGATERCDGADNDCDGSADFDAEGEVDSDGDGWLTCEECDDANSSTYPGAAEICDGEDNDCDEQVPADEADLDGDGQAVCEGDCSDLDPNTWEGAPEICDEIDNDCDGTAADEAEDIDGDEQTPCDGDCDDTNADTHVDADEICDGLDNDCDGEVPYEEVDADGDGWVGCDGDCDDTNADSNPDGSEDTAELCNDGSDNDCDGKRDGSDDDCDGLAVEEEEEPGSRRAGGCALDVGAGSRSSGTAWLLIAGLGLGLRRRRS